LKVKEEDKAQELGNRREDKIELGKKK